MTISEAVLGGKINVKTIYGDINVKINSGTNDGDVKKIVNYGVTKLAPNQNQKGHHFAKIRIIIPKKLNECQRRIFEELSKFEDSENI